MNQYHRAIITTHILQGAESFEFLTGQPELYILLTILFLQELLKTEEKLKHIVIEIHITKYAVCLMAM